MLFLPGSQLQRIKGADICRAVRIHNIGIGIIEILKEHIVSGSMDLLEVAVHQSFTFHGFQIHPAYPVLLAVIYLIVQEAAIFGYIIGRAAFLDQERRIRAVRVHPVDAVFIVQIQIIDVAVLKDGIIIIALESGMMGKA